MRRCHSPPPPRAHLPRESLPRDAACPESPSHATPPAPRAPPTRRRRSPHATQKRRSSPTEKKTHSTSDLDALVVEIDVALSRKRISLNNKCLDEDTEILSCEQPSISHY